jgi:hypothetical protein
MAQLVLTNADISIAGTDLSSLSNSLTLNYEIDSVEATGFGSNHNFIGGLQNNSVEISLMQDFASLKTEATVFPLVGTTCTLIFIPVKGTGVSATNPRYTITGAFLAAHTPVAAAVGELAMTSLTFTGGTLVKTTS